jgi:TonB family protein
LTYPPIANAARFEGMAILIATFDQDGSVSKVKVVSSPGILEAAAVDYVKGWKANPYSGPRECPVVIEFALGAEADHPKVAISRTDIQHVRIKSETYAASTFQYSVASK